MLAPRSRCATAITQVPWPRGMWRAPAAPRIRKRMRRRTRMSKEALTTVVQRSMRDPAFRRQLATDATSALGSYDLTADESSALRSRDAGKLTSLGVDVRMSKVFTLDPGMLGSASLTSVEPLDVAPVWIGDYPAIAAAVQSPDAVDRNMAFTDAAATSGAVQSPDAIERNLSHTSGGDDAGPHLHL